MIRKWIAFLLIAQGPGLMAYEQAFDPTRAGVTEIKELPAGRLLECKGDRSYFDSSNQLFRPLFNYIKKNEIAMTTPVEARMDPGAMYFWVSDDQADRATRSSGDVRVLDVPKRTVVARGGRGSYSRQNFEEVKASLLKWLEGRSDLQMIGEPFAVYWNGPFTPWFMKRFEVQVEVEFKRNSVSGKLTL